MILLLSNGAGEDSIGASLAAHLDDVSAFPLIGTGAAYRGRVPVLGPSQHVPSQGLARESWRLVAADLSAGLLGQVVRQLRFLRSIRRQVRLTVCVGDLFPVGLAVAAGLSPLAFVGTAKSSWHHGYSWPERWVLKRFVRLSLVRDEPTARALRARGVRAEWVGNAMMDQLGRQGLDLEVGGPCVALFPGSREATYTVLPHLLGVCARLGVAGLVAVADSVDCQRLAASCPGWSYEARGEGPGLVGHLTGPVRVGLVTGALGDLLASCQVALGQAGTAHEQAAGAGVPVVATGRLGWYRGRQKGLLGDALEVVEDYDAAVHAVRRLLADPAERARRAAVGRARMGPAGATARMAALLRDGGWFTCRGPQSGAREVLGDGGA